MRSSRPTHRAGAATVELAVLLPFLMFLFVAAVDYGRIFYYTQVIEQTARNGAIYGSQTSMATWPLGTVPTDPETAAAKSLEEATLSDAKNLSPPPTVTSTRGFDAAGDPFIQVTVTWEFNTVTNFPGIPSTSVIRRTCQMRVAPQ